MSAHITLERFVTPSSELAVEVARLRKRAGLSRRQLEVVSGVSEETIKAIEYGHNTHPTPDTLKKIADGLATNRALARLDREAADEMLSTLMRAARYMPEPERTPTPIAPDIVAELTAMFPPEEAELLADTLRGLARHDDRRRRFLLRTFGFQVAEIPTPE